MLGGAPRGAHLRLVNFAEIVTPRGRRSHGIISPDVAGEEAYTPT